MTTEIKDPEFARFIEEAANSLSLGDLPLAFGIVESIAASAVALWDAFATAEPGLLRSASKGMAAGR